MVVELIGSIFHEMIFLNPDLVGILMCPFCRLVNSNISTLRQCVFLGSMDMNSLCFGLLRSERMKLLLWKLYFLGEVLGWDCSSVEYKKPVTKFQSEKNSSPVTFQKCLPDFWLAPDKISEVVLIQKVTYAAGLRFVLRLMYFAYDF